VLVLVLFLVIAGRLVELQLTDAAAYAADGLKQRLREVPLLAPRGSILDRSGAVLARSVDARYVYADPEMIDDRAGAAAKLSPVLGVAKSVLTERMKRSVRENGQAVRFVYLARGVSVAVGDRVTALNIKGIGVHRDERREVPGHDLAANIIGFTGQDANGLTGLEAQYDSVLRGRDGERVDEIGMNGVSIPDGYHRLEPAKPGKSLRLTVDRDLQYEAQRTLAAKMQEVRASFGSAVVLDVHTGEVRAMASWPSYDAANAFEAPGSRWTDYNTAAVVEPGSVHKPFVIGAALEAGVITPNSTPVVAPTITKGGVTYRDTHWHDTREMTIPGILAHSSNVGTIGIAGRLGAKRLYDCQRRFGLGQPTGIGVPGEASGIVQPPSRWSGSSYGSIPIGMGVAVTPIQMAAAYAAIANDGVWLQPRLVDGTIDSGGTFTAAPAGKHHRVLSAKTARQLRLMMEAVTTAPDATGLQAAIPGYRVAGKTGTGLKVTNNRYEYGNVTSFVGMAPADAPRFVVAVFAHVPHGAGGGTAGPVFRSIMTAALQHYSVPPTGRKAPHFQIYA
jgi:cell division protein FtsI (penicillin-binding protein 3)